MLKVLFLSITAILCTVQPTWAAQHKHHISHHSHPAKIHIAETPIDCLANGIVHETQGTTNEDRDLEGMLILKRTTDKNFPNTVCEVIHQKYVAKGKYHCQFSWMCTKKKERITENEKRIARERAEHLWANREQAHRWRVEYNTSTCHYDHDRYSLIRRTKAQCYLAEKKGVRSRHT